MSKVFLDLSQHSDLITQVVITFTWNGFRRGFRLTLPLALSVFVYGLVYGMLAQKAGLSVAECLVMSLTVFAGASQFIAVEMWDIPLPVIPIILTTFIINARHLLMGAAVHPWFRHLKPLQAYGGIFFCADENWALVIREFRKGEKDAALLVGGGFAIYLFWFLASSFGFLGGTAIEDPAKFGLDFTFTAVFVALVVSMWHGKRDLIPWLVAAIVALLTEEWLGGKWYILTGALAGSSLELFRNE